MMILLTDPEWRLRLPLIEKGRFYPNEHHRRDQIFSILMKYTCLPSNVSLDDRFRGHMIYSCPHGSVQTVFFCAENNILEVAHPACVASNGQDDYVDFTCLEALRGTVIRQSDGDPPHTHAYCIKKVQALALLKAQLHYGAFK